MRKRIYQKSEPAYSKPVMHPEAQNIGAIHAECADKRRDKWQQDSKPSDVKVGDFVQLGFTDPNGIIKDKEHMWVQVTKIYGENMKGFLNNTPCILTTYTIGDLISFTYDEIEAIIPA